MKPIRSVTAAAAIGAATATIVTALAFGQTLPAPDATPAATVSPTDEPTTPSALTPDAPTTAPEAETDPSTDPPVAPGPKQAAVSTPGPEPTPTPEPTVEEVGGTIRWMDKKTWAVLDNATHVPFGVSSVELRKDRVRIHFTFAASQVRTFDVSVDEAFASSNVRVGTSVGLRHADVFFYMGTNKAPVNPAQLSRAGANVWFSGSFVVPPEAAPQG